MILVLTQWHKENPNFWCALDMNTRELLDTDCELTTLVERTKDMDVVYVKNWTRLGRNRNTEDELPYMPSYPDISLGVKGCGVKDPRVLCRQMFCPDCKNKPRGGDAVTCKR